MAVLGISRADFWELTNREFSELINAYNANEEQKFRTEAELIRMQVWFNIKPHIKGNPSPSELWPLPWEVQKVEISTKDDFKKAIEKYNGRK